MLKLEKHTEMKTQIESPLKTIAGQSEAILHDFNSILSACLYSKDRDSLYANMKPFQDSIHFGFGFSAGHMWVKQRYLYTRELHTDRLLFVEC